MIPAGARPTGERLVPNATRRARARRAPRPLTGWRFSSRGRDVSSTSPAGPLRTPFFVPQPRTRSAWTPTKRRSPMRAAHGDCEFRGRRRRGPAVRHRRPSTGGLLRNDRARVRRGASARGAEPRARPRRHAGHLDSQQAPLSVENEYHRREFFHEEFVDCFRPSSTLSSCGSRNWLTSALLPPTLAAEASGERDLNVGVHQVAGLGPEKSSTRSRFAETIPPLRVRGVAVSASLDEDA